MTTQDHHGVNMHLGTSMVNSRLGNEAGKRAWGTHDHHLYLEIPALLCKSFVHFTIKTALRNRLNSEKKTRQLITGTRPHTHCFLPRPSYLCLGKSEQCKLNF